MLFFSVYDVCLIFRQDFNLNLDDAAVGSPAIRRRKQQLIFADSETRITRDQMCLQFKTGQKTGKPMVGRFLRRESAQVMGAVYCMSVSSCSVKCSVISLV